MPLTGTKKWYKSKTMLSIITILVLLSNRLFGFEITESDIQAVLEAIGIAIASVIALYGRYTAKQELEP